MKKIEQSTLFDLNQYQAKQSHLGDWQEDVTGDDDPAWSQPQQELSVGDKVCDRNMLRHGDRVFEITSISENIGWAYLAADNGSVKSFLPLSELRLATDIESKIAEITAKNSNIDHINDSIAPDLTIDIESKIAAETAKNSHIDHINDSISHYGIITEYYGGGTARGTSKYFRYSYRSGKKMKHIHIPGGNTANPLVGERIGIIQRAINEGRSHTEIQQLISNWQRKRSEKRSKLIN